MVQQTLSLPAYLYVQYADDDDLQAFVAAFNGMAQAYVTWFATVGLPFYPGLTGELLNWVALGLYGLERTQLTTPIVPAQGPLNTLMLNQPGFPLNTFVAPSQSFYALSDDFFQRILTWDLYKGDGKRYSIPWLKRRIMRFIVGANGLEPNPFYPPLTPTSPFVGPENTQAISVQVAAGAVTVTINQALISALVPNLAPGILQIFQLAFEGGNLDLPAQYTYTCNLQTVLIASCSPATEVSVGTAASQTTGSTTVILSGGSGDYTYAWAWKSGGSGISIDDPAAGSTTFTASGLALGTGVSGVALCTVTDLVTSNTATAVCTVGIERASAVGATASPTTLSVTSAASVESTATTTVTASGGIPPYTYAWAWSSGGSGIEIDSPSAASTGFSSIAQAAGTTLTGTALCTVTDSFSQTGTATVAVSITRVSAVTAAASPTSIGWTGASANITTGSTTVSASGGSGTYTYTWSWQSGGSSIAILSPSAATTAFEGEGLAPGANESGVAACVVKDAYGQTVTVTVPVSINRATLLSASVSPTSESSSGRGTTQATGTAVVSASGGGTPYTYAWAWSSGGSGIGINSPSSADTSFTAANMTNGHTYSGVAQCTVRDAYGQTSAPTVAVTIECIGNGTAVIKLGFGTNPPATVDYWGYGGFSGGTLVSQTIPGATMGPCYTTFTSSESEYVTVLVLTASPNPGQAFFTELETSLGNLAASSATYTYSGTTATWTWTGAALWSGGSVGTDYTITLTNIE